MDKRKLAAVLLLLTGGVWFLQGINVIPGSFMTGDLRWSVAGILSFAIGFFLWNKNN